METTFVVSRRERVRQSTIDEIKEIARAQINRQGAAALSLGKIARRMGLTTPALYRYFASRDELVTELIVDAYQSLGDAVETAVADLQPGDYDGRFRALLHAYRSWAVVHPEEFALCFGTPVAGYAAPLERIMPGAMRSVRQIATLLQEARAAGRLTMPAAYENPPAGLRASLATMQQALLDTAVPVSILTLTVTIWLHAHALVWQELHGHLPSEMFGGGALYAMEVDVMAQRLGLDG